MMAAEDDTVARCRRNLAAVQDRIAAACRQAGRDPAEVRLVGVTKYVSNDLTRMLLDADCSDLGESRPQSLWEKGAALAGHEPRPHWHLIGHLQRNKIRRTLPLLTLLHSLDSVRLAEAIEAEAAPAGIICDTLVEVNLTGNPARTGVMEADVPTVLEVASRMAHVRVVGLMGMASEPTGDERGAAAQRQFARLRELRDELIARIPTPTGLSELSMGMSGDFESAILEGSTLVRVGSTLWEGIS